MIKNVLISCLLLLITTLSYAHPVTILYFTDAHEISPVIDGYGERGGVARLKSVIDSVKKENPEAIVVFGGDCAGGTLFGALYHGFPQIEAFNMIPLDIASFGQHDFDFGIENNLKLIENSKFEWITSNLVDEDGTAYADLPGFTVIERAGIKIGFIGLTDAMATTRKTDRVFQLDLMLAADEVLKLMKKENPDLIIAITQTDVETNKSILQKFPEINAILTEERSETNTEISWVGKRPIISPCGNVGSVARLDIHENKDEYTSYVTAYPVDAHVKQNPEMMKFEETYQNDLDKKLGIELTFLATPLIAGITTDHASRWKETNIGNLLTDSFREYYQADIAVLNGGGIRADADSDSFTLKEAQSIIPFGNRICLIEVTGKEIRKMLEHGVSEVEKKAGKFLQISGATYVYDQVKEPGKRVVKIHVAGEPIQEDKLYTLALPDFLLDGGDGFTIKVHKVIVSPHEGPKDIEVFVDYCSKRDKLDPALEERIQ